MAKTGEALFLGFDLSTQQLKILAVDEGFCLQEEETVQFDKELPEFETIGGTQKHEDGLTVTVPTLLWVKAFDLLLEKLKKKGFDFAKVVCLSGTGQQHGSVYWKSGAREMLRNLNPGKCFAEQLKNSFAIKDSPIWMDSSTTNQCRNLEQTVGGAQELANLTGSRAYERFTGNQIAKIYKNQQADYEKCERISLVSSFLASLCLSDYAPIDFSDGSGMNLLNIHTKTLEPDCLQACAPNLEEKLGKFVASSRRIGHVSSYLCERYGFLRTCEVVAFTGDNPASLAGVRLGRGDVCVSLGTSDTLMFWLTVPKPALGGHVFVNPVDENAYMGMLCFKNGSLVRESIRDSCSSGSWSDFEQTLKRSSAGNHGNIGIYFLETEIRPFAQGTYRFDKDEKHVESFSKDVEIRALVEGQFLAKRVHAEALGYYLDESSHILATGGASKNRAILQVLSDVFNTPVYTIPGTANSACLGCTYRAKHGWSGTRAESTFEEIFKHDPEYKLAVRPNEENRDIYDRMLKQYQKLEESISMEN